MTKTNFNPVEKPLHISILAERFWQKSLQRVYSSAKIAGKLGKVYRGPRHVTFPVRLTDSGNWQKALKLSETFALEAGVKNVVGLRIGPYIVYQIELPETYWESYSLDKCSGLTIGYGDMKKAVEFSFQPPHTLIAGTTDSGKTETEKSILVTLAKQYTPAQLQLIIVDPHHDYEDLSNLAHLVGPIASTGDDIRSAIGYAAKILIHRRTNNLRIDKIPDLPRVVLAIDEADADIVFQNDENVTDVAALASEARKFGVNIIVGVQKPTHKKMPDILDKLNQKFVGLVDDAQLSAKLTGRDGLECHKLTGYGDFVQVRGNNVVRFQVAKTSPESISRLDRREPRPWEVVENDWTQVLLNMSDEQQEEIEAELAFAPEKQVGRPNLTLNMKLLAHYLANGIDAYSRSTARQLLTPIAGYDVTRGVHNLHRDAASELMVEYKAITNSKQLIIGDSI